MFIMLNHKTVGTINIYTQVSIKKHIFSNLKIRRLNIIDDVGGGLYRPNK